MKGLSILELPILRLFLPDFFPCFCFFSFFFLAGVGGVWGCGGMVGVRGFGGGGGGGVKVFSHQAASLIS